MKTSLMIHSDLMVSFAVMGFSQQPTPTHDGGTVGSTRDEFFVTSGMVFCGELRRSQVLTRILPDISEGPEMSCSSPFGSVSNHR